MPTKMLLGGDASSTNMTANYFYLYRYQATLGGLVDAINFYCNVNGTVKVALYADSSGTPSTLLSAKNTATSVTGGGFNYVQIPEVVVLQNTYYWLGINMSTSGVARRTARGSGTCRYRSASYSSFSFPNPAGSGFTSNTYGSSVQCYGFEFAIKLDNGVQLAHHETIQNTDVRINHSTAGVLGIPTRPVTNDAKGAIRVRSNGITYSLLRDA
jgi:hypothetical protein